MIFFFFKKNVIFLFSSWSRMHDLEVKFLISIWTESKLEVDCDLSSSKFGPEEVSRPF